MTVEVAQLCLTLCYSMDRGAQGAKIHGVRVRYNRSD